MAERPVLVGLIPQAVVLDPGDQVSWMSDAGNLKVEFDANRCPFGVQHFSGARGHAAAQRAGDAGNKSGKLQVPTVVE